eukprot:Awhi_evm1s5955
MSSNNNSNSISEDNSMISNNNNSDNKRPSDPFVMTALNNILPDMDSNIKPMIPLNVMDVNSHGEDGSISNDNDEEI